MHNTSTASSLTSAWIEAVAARDAKGHWVKGGPSPNPKGAARRFPEAREALEAGLPKAVEYLVSVIGSVAHDPKDRIAAAKTIMDFGMPKPRDADDKLTAAAALKALADVLAEPE